MARTLLDRLYRLSGYLAAVFLFLIAATIIAQVVGRFFGVALDSTETGGFCLAGMTFLGLAYTLKAGGHIRVNLLIRHFGGRPKWLIELFCTGLATVAIGYFAYQAALLTWDSWVYNDLSPGLLGMPFWIPQLAMTFGISVFTIALADEFCCILAGSAPTYEATDELALVTDHGAFDATRARSTAGSATAAGGVKP